MIILTSVILFSSIHFNLMIDESPKEENHYKVEFIDTRPYLTFA